MNDSEATNWVTSWIEGSTEAFAILVEHHGDAVYNLAYRMCGNRATAEDIAQETFIRAHQRRHRYKPEYALRNWLLAICANRCRSRYRGWRRNKNTEHAFAEEQEIERDIQSRDNGMFEHKIALERALMALPETLRAPLILQYMEGMTIQEVADTLHLRLSAAKMRLTRGRDQLRGMLQQTVGKRGKP